MSMVGGCLVQNPLWEEGRWYRVDLRGARGVSNTNLNPRSISVNGEPPYHRECICVRDQELIIAGAAGELDEGSAEAAAYERLVEHFRDLAVDDCNEMAAGLGLSFPPGTNGIITCETAVENDLPPYRESDRTCGATKGECFAPDGWGGSGGVDDTGDGDSDPDGSTSADDSGGFDTGDEGDGPDESELDPRAYLGIRQWSEIIHPGVRGNFHIDGWAVDKIRQNPTVMLNDGGFVGLEKCGIKIHSAPSTSFLGSLGISPGGCIDSINGIEIRDADTAIEAFNELSTAGNLTAYVRYGSMLRIRLQLFFD